MTIFVILDSQLTNNKNEKADKINNYGVYFAFGNITEVVIIDEVENELGLASLDHFQNSVLL